MASSRNGRTQEPVQSDAWDPQSYKIMLFIFGQAGHPPAFGADRGVIAVTRIDDRGVRQVEQATDRAVHRRLVGTGDIGAAMPARKEDIAPEEYLAGLAV